MATKERLPKPPPPNAGPATQRAPSLLARAQQGRKHGFSFVDQPLLVSIVHLRTHRGDVGAQLLLTATAKRVRDLSEGYRRLSILRRLDDGLWREPLDLLSRDTGVRACLDLLLAKTGIC